MNPPSMAPPLFHATARVCALALATALLLYLSVAFDVLQASERDSGECVQMPAYSRRWRLTFTHGIVLRQCSLAE